MLFHVSEHGGIEGFELRRADESSEPRVWAIDDDRLRNYLVPRDCPRVTYYAGANTSPSDVERFLEASHAVIAFEHAWLARVRSTRLFCYQLPPEGFELADACAGYFVSRHSVKPLSVRVRRRLLERARQPRRRGPRAAESMGFARRGRQVDARVLDDPHAKCHAAFGLTISAASTKSMAAKGSGPGLRQLSALRAGKAPKGNRCGRERGYDEAAEKAAKER